MDFVDQFPRPTPPPGHPYSEMANNKNTRCGMASGSPAIVTVFVVVCCGWSRDITRSLYVKIGTKLTFRKG